MSIDEIIAQRLWQLRKSKGLSLEQLAELSAVSKAMISKIERQESSPSATLLGKLAAGLGVSVTQLLSETQPAAKNLWRREEQNSWQDPDIGYLRRQVMPPEPLNGLEMVEITLPPKARVSYPSWGLASYQQQLWLQEGELSVDYGESRYALNAGDALRFGVDVAVTYANTGNVPCRYLLVIHHPQGVLYAQDQPDKRQ
jgi:transcriptional regulator with XRE-family HTH domain